MGSNLKYMFVPSKYEDEVVQNAIASYVKAETRIEYIRAKHGMDAKVVHCKQHYYVIAPDLFEKIYDKMHTFKLGE